MKRLLKWLKHFLMAVRSQNDSIVPVLCIEKNGIYTQKDSAAFRLENSLPIREAVLTAEMIADDGFLDVGVLSDHQKNVLGKSKDFFGQARDAIDLIPDIADLEGFAISTENLQMLSELTEVTGSYVYLSVGRLSSIKGIGTPVFFHLFKDGREIGKGLIAELKFTLRKDDENSSD